MQSPPEPFDAFWRRQHPDAPPLSFVMREAASENWVRFHSLPESKRYPDGEAEMAVVLGRANALASAVLGDGQPIWLVQAIATDRGAALEPERWLSSQAQGFVWAMTAPEPGDEEYTDWHFFAGPAVWMAGAFDSLVAEVALERAPRTLWASMTTGAVFAPYDGGTDLFLQTPGEVEVLRRRHGDWLSTHPGGW